jgi:hypothetical protein
MEVAEATGVHGLQHIVVGGAFNDIGVNVRVVGPHQRGPVVAGDEVTELGVVARLVRTAPEVKADVIYLGSCLPFKEHLTVTPGSGKGNQGYDGRCIAHTKQEQSNNSYQG